MSSIADFSSGNLEKIAEVLHQLAQEVEDGCAGIMSIQYTISQDDFPKLEIVFVGTGKHEDDLMPFRVKRDA